MKGFIYSLSDPRTNIIRYVGQTTYPLKKRYNEHIRNSKYEKTKNHSVYRWINELMENQLLPIIDLLETCEVESLNDREIYWIKKYFGENLTNMTKGGDGIAFIEKKPFTDEHRKKIGDSCRGEKNYRYGKPAHNIRAIYQFNLCDESPLDEFNSLKEAVVKTGVSQPSISFCLTGERNSGGNYIWIYKDIYDADNSIINEKRKNIALHPSNNDKSRIINKINIDTNKVVATYKSTKEAARKNNTSSSAIYFACNKSITHIYRNFKWEYEKV